MHRHRPVSRWADQRIPAQRRDRVTGRQRVLQQRRQHRARLLTEPPGQARAGLQQQPQRDRLRRAERQQPQQPGRARRGLPQVLKRQLPCGGHRPGVLGRLAPAQQVRAPLPEQGQVSGQALPAGLDIRGGLLQRQRQPAQNAGQAQGRPPVRIPGAADQEIRGHLRVQHRHLHALTRRPDLVPASDQHPARPGRGHERRHRGPVRRVVEHQQPRRRAGGQHRVHRDHRVPAIGGAQLGGQLAEPGRQHRRILGGQLPGHRDLAQLPVRVLHRHAGLARAAQPAQRHQPRPGIVTSGQPGLQLGQQRLPPGQEHRPRRQPQHPARRHRAGLPVILLRLLVQLVLDPGAQTLDQALQVAELRWAHCSGHLITEPEHQRRPGRILQIRQAHVGDTGAQQRHPRDAALPGPPELQLRDGQTLRVVLRGLEPVPVPRNQHVQVTGGDIVQAAVPHGVAVGQVAVDRLMPGQPQPVQHRPPFLGQVGDRGRYIDLGHHHPQTRSRSHSRACAQTPRLPGDLTIAQHGPASTTWTQR